jgi:hypothetical protein
MGQNILCRGLQAPERGFQTKKARRAETSFAGAFRPTEREIQTKKARRADTLIPDIPLIKFNLMLLQQGDVIKQLLMSAHD